MAYRHHEIQPTAYIKMAHRKHGLQKTWLTENMAYRKHDIQKTWHTANMAYRKQGIPKTW